MLEAEGRWQCVKVPIGLRLGNDDVNIEVLGFVRHSSVTVTYSTEYSARAHSFRECSGHELHFPTVKISFFPNGHNRYLRFQLTSDKYTL